MQRCEQPRTDPHSEPSPQLDRESESPTEERPCDASHATKTSFNGNSQSLEEPRHRDDNGGFTIGQCP